MQKTNAPNNQPGLGNGYAWLAAAELLRIGHASDRGDSAGRGSTGSSCWTSRSEDWRKLPEIEFAPRAALDRKSYAADLDVRDYLSIQNAVAAIEAHFGHIDILVNNAGCNIRKPAMDVTWDDWNTVLDTNLRGSFFVAQAVARGMQNRGYGRIINIGSVTSVAGYAGLGPYGASRGGILL